MKTISYVKEVKIRKKNFNIVLFTWIAILIFFNVIVALLSFIQSEMTGFEPSNLILGLSWLRVFCLDQMASRHLEKNYHSTETIGKQCKTAITMIYTNI